MPIRVENIKPPLNIEKLRMVTVEIPIKQPYIIFACLVFGALTGSVAIKKAPKRKPPPKTAIHAGGTGTTPNQFRTWFRTV